MRLIVKVSAAVFTEQNIPVAVIIVKYQACLNAHDQQKTLAGVSGFFQDAHTIIMWERPDRRNQFYGRTDIVNFLSNIHPSRLPWKEYTFS